MIIEANHGIKISRVLKHRDKRTSINLSMVVKDINLCAAIYGGPRKDVTVGGEIKIVHVGLHFGGWRSYFICPQCGGRCTVLYLTKSYKLACHRCAGNYASTADRRRWYEPATRLRRLAYKLGLKPEDWPLPCTLPYPPDHFTITRRDKRTKRLFEQYKADYCKVCKFLISYYGGMKAELDAAMEKYRRIVGDGTECR